jgi:hypothetical protein
MDFMAYSGKYIVKIPSKYKGDHTKVVYRSMWERNAFAWCESNTSVKEWSSEEVVIPYYYDVDKKYHRYFMDLRITYTLMAEQFLLKLSQLKKQNHLNVLISQEDI